MSGLRKLALEEEGQATTEYILLLAASVSATIAMSRVILKGFDKTVLTFGGALEKDLKTGRVSIQGDHGVSLWTN